MTTLALDGHAPLTLRDYQEEALARIDAAEQRGIRRQLGVAATGLGKTIIFCSLAERRGGRTLILAHRDELITQAVDKVRSVWPTADVGVVKAERNERNNDVVVASVQTLARTRRLAEFVGASGSSLFGPNLFDLVVVDEAHHTAADSYRRILDALRAGQDDGPLLLGVTATPDRGDGKGLDDLFDEITFTYDLLWGIRSGYLCDLRGLRVRLDRFNSTELKVRRGDYDQGEAGRMLEDADAPAMIARSWLEHAAGRRTLVFTPTVALAEATAAEFVGLGVRASWVAGETPLEERRALLARFSRGEIDVLANCAVLTEGFDEPRVDCVVVARPTRSRALYTQMVGRGTRRHPDKVDCLVMDIVGASDDLSLVTVPSLFGLRDVRQFEHGEGTVSAAVWDQEQADIAEGRLRAEEVELFRRVVAGGIAWVQVPDERFGGKRYVRPLGKDQPTVVLARHDTDADHWLAGVEYPDHAKRVLIRDVALEVAQGVGEDFIRKQGGGALVDRDAAWRSRKPSAKQRALAKRLGVKLPKGATAGDVSDLLTEAMASRRSPQRAG